ncbi:hypothetical protein [Aeromonas salmonicida]|uniref:hypothetical protein n=1 Tax=Aeromonas salmonicida TaxID=645 RepID=UPI001EF4F2E5|nr:hypothetical protein [Aeromonas salmonicida]
MKRFTHDADLRGMVVLRSLGFQLVPFKPHRFRKQRHKQGISLQINDGLLIVTQFDPPAGVYPATGPAALATGSHLPPSAAAIRRPALVQTR